MKYSKKFAYKILNEFGRKSIFYKYWIRTFIIVLIPFVILNMCIYFFMSNHTDYIIEENYNKELNSSSLSLDNILEDIYDKFLYFCVDENVL